MKALSISLLLFLFCAARASAADEVSFTSGIQPLLARHCESCHGSEEQNAQVDFSRLMTDRKALRERKLWRKAIAQIEAGQMPPPDSEQPSELERQQLLTWMKAAVVTIDSTDPANRDPGHNLIRRLTLTEYNNTIRDLLGFEFDASTVGLTNVGGEGNPFGNMAAALEISPAEMDKYFAAADKILDRFFSTELSSGIDGQVQEDARMAREQLFGLNPGQWRQPNTIITPPEGIAPRNAAQGIIAGLARRAYRRPMGDADLEPLMALYDQADQAGAGYVGSIRPAMKVLLVSPYFLYRIEGNQPEQPADEIVPVSDIELASRLSYFLWSSMPDEQLLDLAERGKLTKAGPSDEPIPLVGTVIGGLPGSETFQGNNRDQVFDSKLHTFLDGPDNNSHWIGLDLGRAREFRRIRFAARQAHEYRMVGGKVQASSTADFGRDVVDLFEITEQPPRGYVTREFEKPLNFRYVRYVPPPNSYGNIAELEVWGVAEGTVLEQQLQRMLADPKAHALSENFAARWLQIDKLSTARPSTEFFPEFNADVRQAMHDETIAVFDHLRQADRPLVELLNADYTFVNDKLAAFYGIAGVEGKEMRSVQLKPEHHRGGLLGMGSILALTSHTSRTSPTLRGKWLLETIFGTAPPPPPANVSMIKEEGEKGKEPTTFREKLAQHAKDPTCASCHRRMDPLGFALDNYNAVGQWRADQGGRPLDVSGILPSGETIRGAEELKALVVAQRSQFIHNLTEQMLSYALGRELDFYDDGPVRAITVELEKNDFRFSTLISGVVQSYPFQNRKQVARAE